MSFKMWKVEILKERVRIILIFFKCGICQNVEESHIWLPENYNKILFISRTFQDCGQNIEIPQHIWLIFQLLDFSRFSK